MTGFIGSSGKGAKPFPVSQEEIDSVLRRLGHENTPVQADFAAGDQVDIIGGAFEGSTGKVESMDDESRKHLFP